MFLSTAVLLPLLVVDVTVAIRPLAVDSTPNSLQPDRPFRTHATEYVPPSSSSSGSEKSTTPLENTPNIEISGDGKEVTEEISSLAGVGQAADKKHPPSPVPARKLHGRFIHITDLHPDEFYVPNSAVSSFCHRKKPKKDPERAGYYGVPFSDCDSPLALTDLTLKYMRKQWADNVDFVIWTGDSARHDNDNKLPRTPNAIYQMNRNIAQQMMGAFPNVPIVPNLGNNDIWPHNVMQPGPNSITSEYSAIWRPFIPFSSYQVFQRGGYFSKEVIPDHIAVISLNTMYWYDSNKAVGGCGLHEPNDPGNLQFDWLDVQLQQYRKRQMQVILMGHVPPSPGNYFPDCHFRYGQIAIRYQDTIVGHFFGHMNVDHFFWLDVHDLSMEPTDPDIRTKKSVLHEDLREDISDLPKEIHHSDYVVVNVGPSIIPAYLPSFRVYQYNITDYSGPKISDDVSYTRESWDALDVGNIVDDEDEEDESIEVPRYRPARSIHSTRRIETTGKRRHRHRHPEMPDCSKPENAEKYACRPWGPRHANSSSPSRTNTLWSLLGYAQYYMPDLGESTKKNPPKFKLEYVTHSVDALHPPNETETQVVLGGTEVGMRKKGGWIPPVPKHLLPKSLRDSNRTTSKFAPYELDDLTIPGWIELARRLGDSKKLWKKFLRYMYMGQDPEAAFDGAEWEEEDGFVDVFANGRNGAQLPLLVEDD